MTIAQALEQAYKAHEDIFIVKDSKNQYFARPTRLYGGVIPINMVKTIKFNKPKRKYVRRKKDKV